MDAFFDTPYFPGKSGRGPDQSRSILASLYDCFNSQAFPFQFGEEAVNHMLYQHFSRSADEPDLDLLFLKVIQ